MSFTEFSLALFTTVLFDSFIVAADTLVNDKLVTKRNFEELIEMFKPVLNRVNEPSLYITLTNKCMVCKKSKSVDVVATEEVMPSLSEAGLLCKPYAYKAAPYLFKLLTPEMLEKAKEVLFNV